MAFLPAPCDHDHLGVAELLKISDHEQLYDTSTTPIIGELGVVQL